MKQPTKKSVDFGRTRREVKDIPLSGSDEGGTQEPGGDLVLSQGECSS